jgi:hypothetical protein
VTLLSLGLAQRVLPGDADGLQVLLAAGLAHDVGELYIDPQYLRKDAQLSPADWRHIAAHPVIAHGLIKGLAGVAQQAGGLILSHHERLDGFGYPQGLGEGSVSVPAQIQAVAEMLGGMLERGGDLLRQADVAVKLIPGEFSRAMIDVISGLFKEHRDPALVEQDPSEELGRILEMSRQLGAKLEAILELQDRFQTQFDRGSLPFKAIWQQAAKRFESIRRAWSSTGLDVQPDGAWLQHESPAMQHEVAIILREIDWRLGELERELHARVSRLAAGDLPMLERYLRDWRQTTAQVVQRSGVVPSSAT